MVQTAPPKPAGLYVQNADPQQPMAFPLKHTEVRAQVSGNVSRVEVTQLFENPFTTALEATYVFPLPDEAAVDTMVIRLAGRTLQGRIEKREQAQALYEQAKQQGQTAGLLEQERANIFTQSLANILPGEQIEVVIGYSDRLAYQQGSYEFIFPMVVGPRYIPGNPIEAAQGEAQRGSATAPMTLNQDTDLVPDASQLNAPILPTGVRSGHDIQITVEIETGDEPGGFAIANLRSPSHQIAIDTQPGLTRITLAPSDTLPNKDLILHYQVAGKTTQTSLLTQADERGGHLAVYLMPALSYDSTHYIPKDMVFLIDTSGSQSGAPLAQCQALMRRFIQGLNPQDTFNIVNFANTTQQLSPIPLENTPRNRHQALNYVDRLRAGGGTEMLRGLKTVLNLPELSTERLKNIVLLTDGYIGNETQIFAEVQRVLSPSTRLHSFGAGSSVNRFLLNRAAELGRGIAHVVRHDEAIDKVVDRFFLQINNPVLGNLSLHWDGPGDAPSLYPMAPPDLFAEQPLVLLGRKADSQSGTLQVRGIAAGGEHFEQSFAVSFESTGNPAIAQLWGRARIKDLMTQMVSGETTQGVEAVTETALAYQLLSQYTAFVAVSDEVRVEHPGPSVSVNMPVNMPEAVSYEGIFGATISAQRARIMTARSQPMSAASQLSAPLSSILRQRSKQQTTPEVAQANPPELSPLFADQEALAQAPGELMIGSADIFETEIDQPDLAAPMPASVDLASSSLAASDQIPSPQPTPIQPIQSIKAEGLQADILEQLKQHLQTLQLIDPQSGRLVFELVIQQGRVKRVMLDTEVSDEQNATVIEQLRRALTAWPCSQDIHAPLRVEIDIR